MARKRTDIQPRIVAAARKRFLHDGVDGASLRSIAADAKTSIGMVYYYFKTKDDLFFAVVEDVYSKLLADLTVAFAPDVAPRERMRRLYRRASSITELESQTLRLVVREVLVSSKRLKRLLARFQQGHIPLVLATIRDGIADGSIRGDVPPLLVMIMGFAGGVIPQFILAGAGDRIPYAGPRGEALADQLLELVFTGVGTTSPSKRR